MLPKGLNILKAESSGEHFWEVVEPLGREPTGKSLDHPSKRIVGFWHLPPPFLASCE
jgi:hypothetical protein